MRYITTLALRRNEREKEGERVLLENLEQCFVCLAQDKNDTGQGNRDINISITLCKQNCSIIRNTYGVHLIFLYTGLLSVRVQYQKQKQFWVFQTKVDLI